MAVGVAALICVDIAELVDGRPRMLDGSAPVTIWLVLNDGRQNFRRICAQIHMRTRIPWGLQV